MSLNSIKMRLGSFLKRGISAIGLGGFLLSSGAGCEKRTTTPPEAAVQDTRRDIKRTTTNSSPKKIETPPPAIKTRERVKHTFAPPPLPKKTVPTKEVKKNSPTPPLLPTTRAPRPERSKLKKIAKKAIKIPITPSDRGFHGPLAVGEEASDYKKLAALAEDIKPAPKTSTPPPLKKKVKSKVTPKKPPTVAKVPKAKPKAPPTPSIADQQAKIVAPPTIIPPVVNSNPLPSNGFEQIDEDWNELLASHEAVECSPDLSCPDEEFVYLCDENIEFLEEDDFEGIPTVIAATKQATPPPLPPRPTLEKRRHTERGELAEENRNKLLALLVLLLTDYAACLAYIELRRRKEDEVPLTRSEKPTLAPLPHTTAPVATASPITTKPPTIPRIISAPILTEAQAANSQPTMRLPAIERVLFSEEECEIEMSEAKVDRNIPEGFELLELQELYKSLTELDALSLEIQELEQALGENPQRAHIQLSGQEKIDRFVQFITQCEDNTPSQINNARLSRHKRALTNACHSLLTKAKALKNQFEADLEVLNVRLESETTCVISINEITSKRLKATPKTPPFERLVAISGFIGGPEDDEIDESATTMVKPIAEIEPDDGVIMQRRLTLISQADELHDSLQLKELKFTDLKERIKALIESKKRLLPRNSQEATGRKYGERWQALSKELVIRREVGHLSNTGMGPLCINTEIVKINANHSPGFARRKQAILTPHATDTTEIEGMLDIISTHMPPQPRTIEIKLPAADVRRQNFELTVIIEDYQKSIEQMDQAIERTESILPELEIYCAKLQAAINGLALIPSINELEENLIDAEVELHNAWQVYAEECKSIDRLIGVLKAVDSSYEQEEFSRLNQPEWNASQSIELEKERLFECLAPDNINIALSQKTTLELGGIQVQYQASIDDSKNAIANVKRATINAQSKRVQLEAQADEHFRAGRRRVQGELGQIEISLEVTEGYIEEINFNRERVEAYNLIAREIDRYHAILTPSENNFEPCGDFCAIDLKQMSNLLTKRSLLNAYKTDFESGNYSLLELIQLGGHVDLLKMECDTILTTNEELASKAVFLSDVKFNQAREYLESLKTHVEKHMQSRNDGITASNTESHLTVIEGGKVG